MVVKSRLAISYVSLFLLLLWSSCQNFRFGFRGILLNRDINEEEKNKNLSLPVIIHRSSIYALKRLLLKQKINLNKSSLIHINDLTNEDFLPSSIENFKSN